jgi:hypothetical protein
MAKSSQAHATSCPSPANDDFDWSARSDATAWSDVGADIRSRHNAESPTRNAICYTSTMRNGTSIALNRTNFTILSYVSGYAQEWLDILRVDSTDVKLLSSNGTSIGDMDVTERTPRRNTNKGASCLLLLQICANVLTSC